MELFASATGCVDPEVAAFYLERAGHDLTRAVNHFFDSPVASAGATLDSGGGSASAAFNHGASSAGIAPDAAAQRSAGSDSTRKRQRTGKQDLLAFRHVKPSSEVACGPPSGIEHLGRDDTSLEHGEGGEENIAKSHHGTPAGSTATTTAAGRGAAVAGGACTTMTPSAEWTDTVRRCQR